MTRSVVITITTTAEPRPSRRQPGPSRPQTIKVNHTTEIGQAIREAANGGYGLTPRSSAGLARHHRSDPIAGSAVLDLSGLDEVVLVSARERVAIVEAGVTFAQLEPHLTTEGLRLCHPLLPPAGKSVVAAVMDREPHLVPKYHWDFTDPLLCAELWFGTGDRFRTGSSAGPGASLEAQWKAGMFQKNPLGPAQTDLVKLAQGSRGSLGIAAWASVRLERAPEIRRPLLATADTLEPLVDLTSQLTRRRLGDEIFVLDRPQTIHMAAALGVDAPGRASDRWVLIIVAGSLPCRPEQSISYQLDEISALANISGVTVEDVAGTTDEGFIAGSTAITSPGEDWKRYRTGYSRELSWLTTLDRAERQVTAVRNSWSSIVGDDAVATYIQPINQGRTAHVEVTALVDDATGPRIDATGPTLTNRLADLGAFFSRPVGAAVDTAYARSEDVVPILRRVKQVLDPQGVLSPGALCFDPPMPQQARPRNSHFAERSTDTSNGGDHHGRS